MDGRATANFFDDIAEKWDGWEDLPAARQKFARGLVELGVGTSEKVLDIGCGTGNLSLALLEKLGPDACVHAIDISPRMLDVARRKTTDPRVIWHLGDALQLPMGDATLDRVFCCAVWPHFEDHAAVAREIHRVLRPDGVLHVWHILSRARINQIHATAGETVQKDVLAPATVTAQLLSELGFQTQGMTDDDDRYLVTAVRGM
ncbi:MAG: class I SAM-dependent methyltransferase [Candidatus Ozemobacteraceae bacterium]